MATHMEERWPRVLAIVFFLFPLVGVAVPKATVALLPLAAIAIVASALAEGARARDLFRIDLFLGLFLAAGAYLVVNAAWSADIERALTKAVLLSVYAVLTFASARAVSAWPEARAARLARIFVAGLCLGLAYLLIELATDFGLSRGLYNLLPALRPDDHKAVHVVAGEVKRIQPYELNRGIAVLASLAWAALLYLLPRGGRLRLAGIAFGILSAVAILLSEHDTSQVAIATSLIAFAAACFWPRPARLGLAVCWCLAFLLVVPVVGAAFKADLHHAEWLPFSARARVILWGYTAQQIPHQPWLGIGGSSIRAEDADPKTQAEATRNRPKNFVFNFWAGAHSHNAFLQTWYELGVVGVILFMAAGAGVIFLLGRMPLPAQPYLLAEFAAFFTIIAASWGMWQSWLMAIPGLAVVAGVTAARAVPERGETAP